MNGRHFEKSGARSDADLFIGVCLRSLAESSLGLTVKYCTTGGVQEEKQCQHNATKFRMESRSLVSQRR
jgi:hypothetical protein